MRWTSPAVPSTNTTCSRASGKNNYRRKRQGTVCFIVGSILGVRSVWAFAFGYMNSNSPTVHHGDRRPNKILAPSPGGAKTREYRRNSQIGRPSGDKTFCKKIRDLSLRLRRGRGGKRCAFPIKLPQRVLHQIDFPSFEKRLSALRAHPRRHRIPGHVIAVTVQTKGSCTPLHSSFAMNTFHGLASPSEIFRPLARIGKICRDYSQIFVLRRTHHVYSPPGLPVTEHQTAMAAWIIWVVFDQVTFQNRRLHFAGAYHTLCRDICRTA